MDIKAVIAQELDIPIGLIEESQKKAHIHIKMFRIPKRKGGYRVISQPSAKLKTVQYWLMRNVFELLQIHSAAVAYRKNISILHNAKIHRNNRFFSLLSG